MIADLKPYSEYKDSGLPWLGQVPEHWEVKPLRTMLKLRNEKNNPIKTTQILSLSIARGVTLYSHEGRGGNRAKGDLSAYKIARVGDIVLNSMNVIVGAVGLSRYTGAISPVYYALYPRAESTDIHYFDSLFSNSVFQRYLLIYGKGILIKESDSGKLNTIRMKISPDDLKTTLLPLPPPEEQAAIVRFLDWANGRLERTIRAKRKVIALLNEQKQAIIHRAVTRGLDPNVPLKDTGSQWFPALPLSWEALTLRRVITSAIDGPHFSPQYQDAGVPFLSARNVRADRWILGNAKFISEADYIEFSRRVHPEVGDVLYTKGGTTGVARVVDLTFPFQVWVHIAVLKLKHSRITPAFLAYCLNSPRCYEQAQLFTRGATNQDLGLGRMKDIELPVPPELDEQKAIVDSLDIQCSAFNTAISRLEREIELLREYRTRLVADVVTGKLDVRAAAAQLPEEAPLEPVEDDVEFSVERDAEPEELEV